MAFFTGYGAGVVRFFSDTTSTCSVPTSRWIVPTDRDTGRDEQTSETDQQAVHFGAGRRDLWAPSPLFYLAPRYDFTRLSFELEEIVVRWPNGLRFKTHHRKEQRRLCQDM